MKFNRYQRFLLFLLGSGLILLYSACGSMTRPTTTGHIPTGNVTSPASADTTPSISPTVSVSTTSIDCPPAGKGRAAVMPPLALGDHQNIVYTVNEFQGNTPTLGTLKRYDVAGGTKTEIIKMPNVSITNAQISADGQWILFVANSSAAAKLQMIRMDGQNLQTLYCDTQQKYLGDVQWSPNQKLVIFFNGEENFGLSLLNIQNGSVQQVLAAIPVAILTWFDDTHVYLSPFGGDVPPDAIRMLDISRGANQRSSDLVEVFQQPHTPNRYPCMDFDTYGGSKTFISQCNADFIPRSSVVGKRQGPSTIGVQSPTDTSLYTIFTSTKLAITMVRVISSKTLLLLVENFSADHSADTSQNGLWKINMDSSGLTRLTTEGKGYGTSLSEYRGTPWANGSRDGTMYAFQARTTQNNPATFTLLFGPLGGGTPTTFASISDGTQLAIVGWTTM